MEKIPNESNFNIYDNFNFLSGSFLFFFLLFAKTSLLAQFSEPKLTAFDRELPAGSFHVYDLDGDNDHDVVVRSSQNVLNYYINKINEGGGWEAKQFELPGSYDVSNLELYGDTHADFDGDGVDDFLFFGGYAPNLIVTWFSFNPATETFEAHDQLSFFGYFECHDAIYNYLEDWDRDGDMDVLFNRGWTPFMLINTDGQGAFSLDASLNYLGCHSLEDARDFDKDGLSDLFVGYQGGENPGIYKNSGEASFELWRAIHLEDGTDNVQFINDSLTQHYNYFLGRLVTGALINDSLITANERPVVRSTPRFHHDFNKDGTDERIAYPISDIFHSLEYSEFNFETFQYDKAIKTYNFGFEKAKIGDYNQDGWDDLLIVKSDSLYWMENLNRLPRISGRAYLDLNNNGMRDDGEALLPNAKISSPELQQTLFTNEQGEYVIYAEPGVYNLSADIAEENLQAAVNNGITVEINNGDHIENIDFAFSFINEIQNFDLSILSNITRCNSRVDFFITYENTGSSTTNGRVQLDIDEHAGFVSSATAPLSVENNRISWAFEDLKPFEKRKIELVLIMPSAAFINETLSFQATIEDELSVVRRTDTASSLLRCAFDPNDKQVDPIGQGPEHLTLLEEDLLEYLIRFQNTGNDTAFNVRITDELHPLLNINSFQVVTASHNYRAEIKDRTLTFFFDQILLPDSATNLAASNGYVQFRINTIDNIEAGDVVSNQASIYFDSNKPIVTNEVRNTFVSFICTTLKTEIKQSICHSESYAFGSQTLTDSGVYVETFTSYMGCDSIVTLDLNVLPEISVREDALICANDSYRLGEQTLTATGTYKETFVAVNGCDSIVVLQLTVAPDRREERNVKICEGASYSLGDQVITESGTYSTVFTDANGCNSTRIVHLSVRDTVSTTVNAEICIGSNFAGYSEAGTYIDVFNSSTGCDSTRTLLLRVKENYEALVSHTICAGEIFEGYTESGFYIDQFAAANGCDSTRALELTVQEYTQITLDTILCPGDSLYGYGAPGVYTDTLFGVAGCGVVRTLNLSFLSESDAACFVSTAKDEALEKAIAFYPNPVRDWLTIEFDVKIRGPVLLRLFDMHGRQIIQEETILQRAHRMNIASAASGLYFLHMNWGDRSIVRKIVKME